jgi:hypothetical protein
MTPADIERLRSWSIEIVDAIVPAAKWRVEGVERKLVGSGGLSINCRTGAWYSHSLGRGGWSPVSLIRLLKQCSYAEALTWAQAWLVEHPGTGALDAIDPEEPIEHGEIARGIIAKLGPIEGTPGEANLRKRGIEGAIPDFVKYLPDARCGEGAIAALLTSHGRVVGVQLGYLTPSGDKSLVEPVRRIYMLEPAPDAAFELSFTGTEADRQLATLVCEGLEDSLSVAETGATPPIIGLPGIGRLKHRKAKPGERFIIIRDGDAPGSTADKGLIEGIDSLLLQGAEVRVTATPEGKDANDILRADGIAALVALIAAAQPASLSVEGEIERLSRLAPLDYAMTRKASAKQLGITVDFLDAEVKRRRSRAAQAAEEPEADRDAIELLDEQVDLAATLDAIVVELHRYIVIANELPLAIMALWAAHTHLVHHPHIRLMRSPRLAFQAQQPGEGKTTSLDCTGMLVPRPRPASSVTASSVLRTLDALKVTYLIDEAQDMFNNRNDDLRQVLNAGDRRRTAFAERTAVMPDGTMRVQRFSIWGAVAFACIGELPPALQDRCVVIQMRRALGYEITDHLVDGYSVEFQMLRRRLATWATQIDTLELRPEMPAVLLKRAGRTGDNFRILLAIADAAGGKWPALIRQAALEAVKAEAKPSDVALLLGSIRRVFDTRAERPDLFGDDKVRIPTGELVTMLIVDPEAEWDRANKGRAITIYWLRDHLRHLIDPIDKDKSRWRGPADSDNQRQRYRGYYRKQFTQAWKRYLPPSPETSGPSGPSWQATDFAGFSSSASESGGPDQSGPDAQQASEAPPAGPDASGPGGLDRPPEGPQKPSVHPHGPDGPDVSDGGVSKKRSKPRRKRPQAGDGAAARPTDSLDDKIRAFARAHPKATISRIAKHFGQPKTTVAEVLKGAE